MSGVTTPTSTAASFFFFPSDTTITALLSGDKWGGGRPGIPVTLTYSLPYSTSSSSYWASYYSDSSEPSYAISGLTVTEQQAAEAALQQWANVANISFVKVAETNTTAGDIRFAYTSTPDILDAWGWAYYPDEIHPSGGDIWLNPQNKYKDFSVGSYNFSSLLHELGHALGLKHPFEDGITLPTALDSSQYTVMSYTDHPHATFLEVIYSRTRYQSDYSLITPQTPMLYDIAAMQYLYGANTSYKTGDDVYSFDVATPFFMTIWDAGGNDTISVSNFSKGCNINLQAGQFSKITIESDPIPTGVTGWEVPTYDGTDNLAIAFGVTLENATGGSGNDILTGNGVANRLTGNGGNDFLDGGGGIDIAVYTSKHPTVSIVAAPVGYSISTATEGYDTLVNIERIQLSDVSVALDISGNAGKTAKLLGAVFGVASLQNREYAGIGLGLLDGGMSYEDLATYAINATGAATQQQIVNLLWTNVVGSAPAVDQAQPYINMLNSGMTIGQLGLLAADTELNQANINLVGLAVTGLEYL